MSQRFFCSISSPSAAVTSPQTGDRMRKPSSFSATRSPSATVSPAATVGRQPSISFSRTTAGRDASSTGSTIFFLLASSVSPPTKVRAKQILPFRKGCGSGRPGAERRPARAAGRGRDGFSGPASEFEAVCLVFVLCLFMPCFYFQPQARQSTQFSAAGAAKHAETNSVKTAAPQVLRGVLLSVFTIIVYP